MKALHGLALLLAAPLVAQQPMPHSLPLKATSDGHACSGYFRATHKTLVWKTSFQTCTSAHWTSEKTQRGWVIDLHTQPSPHCIVGAIVVQPQPDAPDFLMVTGYKTLGDIDNPQPLLACTEQE